MRNLELKVPCQNQEQLQTIASKAKKHGATYLHTLKQRDTYFQVPRGRLKLREWTIEEQAPLALDSPKQNIHPDTKKETDPAGATLIAYTRLDEATSRISDYLLSPVIEPQTLRMALTETLNTLVVVEKVRILYQYNNTRIHLDTVAGLGKFVELETMFEETTTIEEATAEHQKVITFLGLDTLPPISSSYSDLLIHASSQPD